MISSEGGSSELRYVGKFTNDDDNLQNIRKIYLRTYFFPLLEIDFISVRENKIIIPRILFKFFL